jgi:hypothetical protein
MSGSFLVMLACVLAFLAAFTGSAPPWYRIPPHLGWLAVAVYFLALIMGR